MNAMKFIKEDIQHYLSFMEKAAAEQKVKKDAAAFQSIDYINARALYEYYTGQIDAYKRTLENIAWAERNLEN